MKKIIFGALFSAMLIMSINFITPVQAQVIEKEQLVKDITSDLENLLDLAEDDKLTELIESTEVQNILTLLEEISYEEIQTILTSDDETLIEQFKETYVYPITNSEKFLELVETTKYNQLINSLTTSLENLYNTQLDTNIPEDSNYKITTDGTHVKIIKQTSDETTDTNSILVLKEENLYFPGYGTLEWDDFTTLQKIFIIIAGGIIGLGAVLAVLYALSLILAFLTTIVTTGIEVLVIGIIVLAAIDFVVIPFANFLWELILQVLDGMAIASKNKTRERMQILTQKFKSFLIKIIEIFNLKARHNLA